MLGKGGTRQSLVNEKSHGQPALGGEHIIIYQLSSFLWKVFRRTEDSASRGQQIATDEQCP
jgi:hypothetical protein